MWRFTGINIRMEYLLRVHRFTVNIAQRRELAGPEQEGAYFANI
jgi:hypothetical protein